MKNWKEELKRQIDASADEVKASAFDAITASDKICTSTRIVIELVPDSVPVVRYEVDCVPRSLFPK